MSRIPLDAGDGKVVEVIEEGVPIRTLKKALHSDTLVVVCRKVSLVRGPPRLRGTLAGPMETAGCAP